MNYFITITFSFVIVLAVNGCGGGGGGGGISGGGSSAPVVWDSTVDSAKIASYKTAEYNSQYGLNSIDSAQAYSLLERNGKAIAGDGVKIAITDTGVNLTHEDIATNNFGSLHSDPSEDWHGHGSNVASIAAGVKNSIGMHGVAFNAEIISVRVALNGDPDAQFGAEEGVGYAAQNGAKVINMSWGGGGYSSYNGDGNLSSEFPEALLAKSADAIMVAAAGNDGDNDNDGQSFGQDPDYLSHPKPSLPALYANNTEIAGYLIAVGAVDQNNEIADFSNICGVAKNYCLVAPGVSIIGAYKNNGFQVIMSGTSQAAPHVTGAAAVLRAAWPYLSAPQTTQILLDTATDLGVDGVDDIYGHGLLNLGNAVEAQGANNISSLGMVDSIGFDARTSSINTNPIFGNAYSKNLAPILKNAVFFDKYGRDYKANLDQKIVSSHNNSYNLDNLLFTNYSSTILPVNFGENNSNNLTVKFNAANIFSDPISGEVKSNRFGLKYLTLDRSREDQSSFRSSDVAFSYSKNFGSNLKIGFNKNDFANDFSWNNPAQNYRLISYNNFASSPYKKLSLTNFTSDGESQINSNQLNITQNITPNLTTNLSYTSYNQSISINRFSSDESRIFETGLNYKLNDKTKLGFNFGNLKEFNNNFLGSNAQGAFSGGSNPQTKYIALNFTRNIVDNWQLATSYSQGKTNVSGNNLGVFRDFDNIQSRGLAIGLLNDNFLNGRFGVVYSEPLRVYKGTTNIDIPISRDFEGNVQRLTANYVSLVPDGKEKDLEFSYSFNLKNTNAQIDFNGVIQQEANNIKNAKDQYLWMAKYNLKF
jgi:hypothetical protein